MCLPVLCLTLLLRVPFSPEKGGMRTLPSARLALRNAPWRGRATHALTHRRIQELGDIRRGSRACLPQLPHFGAEQSLRPIRETKFISSKFTGHRQQAVAIDERARRVFLPVGMRNLHPRTYDLRISRAEAFPNQSAGPDERRNPAGEVIVSVRCCLQPQKQPSWV